jgi:hypothetical protein
VVNYELPDHIPYYLVAYQRAEVSSGFSMKGNYHDIIWQHSKELAFPLDFP